MEGLYKKAQTLRREQRLLRLIRREEPPEEGEFDISTSEGVEILDHLDDVVSRNRLNVQTRTFSFTPQKSGIFFPVAVNIIALAAVLTGILLFA